MVEATWQSENIWLILFYNAVMHYHNLEIKNQQLVIFDPWVENFSNIISIRKRFTNTQTKWLNTSVFLNKENMVLFDME